MAITLNGTQNALPSDRLPSGYTAPVVTSVPDFHYRYDVVVPLVFSTTAQSTASATMTQIVNLTNTAVQAIMTGDFLSTATGNAYAVINDITTNLALPTPTSTTYLLSGTTPSYLVSTTIFVKAL